MSNADTVFLLESWKELCENLQSVNQSLREVVEAQNQTILKMQGIQTSPPIKVQGKHKEGK